MDMLDDKVEGYFLLGQNPAVGSAHGKMQRLGMAHLKWLVVRDLNMIESATFWKDGPEIETGELRTEDIDTEVFFFPAAAHVEKDGTFTQTQRMLQWHHKAVEPPGDCRSELHFFFHLGRKIRERLAGSTDAARPPAPRPDLGLPGRRARRAVGRGGAARDQRLPPHRRQGRAAADVLHRDEAATARPSGGCWIYTGVYADGVNQAARRKPGREQSWVAPEWGWAWPANRRILYNRASADPDGKPWSERKAYVWWDEERAEVDRARRRPTSWPTRRRPTGPSRGRRRCRRRWPATTRSSCRPTARAGCSRPTGLLDGPLPAHYEPDESPVRNPLYRQQANPTREVFPRKDNLQNPSPPEPASDVFPYVFTTYRLTEHHTAGGMSRWLPYLSELQPEFFCEVSPELAARARARAPAAGRPSSPPAPPSRPGCWSPSGWCRCASAADVVHQIGLPYHWGVGGDALVSGDSANDLFGVTLDPNVHIQESKVGSCDIQPGRRPTGPALLRFVEEYRSRAGITVETGNAPDADRDASEP